MQTKLDKFFEIKPKYNLNNKKCFIYDPDNYKAFFINKPDITDIYITTQIDIKLYYRKPSIIKTIKFPIIKCKANIPLLKSNLQKAIRRSKTEIAIKSALAIIQREPIEFLRRLPIIYIEDVSLMDSYPIVVWLMMANKEYKLNINDIDILLNITKNLSEYQYFYEDYDSHIKDKNLFEISHKNLQNLNNKDELLALYYRSKYGGMKGDILMLRNSIYYYSKRTSEIGKTVYNSIDYENLREKLDIIPEAIDFHPFPHIISTLVKLTNFDNNDIREYIWYIESGINIRKPITYEKFKEYSVKKDWQIIKSKLPRIRYNIIQSLL
jgi:hypothetical protein